MANDLMGALRTYLNKLSSGEKSPQEVAAALNQWARESGEAIKSRVEEEVERTVKRMGFAKQSDLDSLEREVNALKAKLGIKTNAKAGGSKKSGAKKSSAKKNGAKKTGVKKSGTSKTSVKSKKSVK